MLDFLKILKKVLMNNIFTILYGAWLVIICIVQDTAKMHELMLYYLPFICLIMLKEIQTAKNNQALTDKLWGNILNKILRGQENTLRIHEEFMSAIWDIQNPKTPEQKEKEKKEQREWETLQANKFKSNKSLDYPNEF